jgi:hypothetical protein
MDDLTSSYATAGIALSVSAALKPHHHNKVETPSGGILISLLENVFLENICTYWKKIIAFRYLGFMQDGVEHPKFIPDAPLKCMVGRTPSCIKTCNSQNTMSAA